MAAPGSAPSSVSPCTSRWSPAGRPGLAIVLAVKGLGRYPELRSQEDTGAAERFIIGTFTSVLWAVACVGVAVLAP